MDISTTETTRTAIGKPLQMRKQHQRSPDTTLCRKTNRTTRGQNSNSFIPISCNNDSYKYSYFPMTLLEWNNLPEGVVSQKTVETFKTSLHSFIEE